MVDAIQYIISTLEKGGRVNSHTFCDTYFKVFNKKFNGISCSTCVQSALLEFKQYLAGIKKKESAETVINDQIPAKETSISYEKKDRRKSR